MMPSFRGVENTDSINMIRRLTTLLLFIFVMSTYRIGAEELSIVAVGDMALGDSVNKTMINKGYGHPFKKVQVVLSSADIAIGNLECPISLRGKPRKKRWRYRANPRVVKGLKYAGFDVLTLANNHAMDYGTLALSDTLDILKDNGLLAIGAGLTSAETRKPAIIESKNTKVAFLGYNCRYHSKEVCSGNIKIIREEIKKIRDNVDIVVVNFHWGLEYQQVPTREQINLAHRTIDAGADIIFGHHPHILQGVEFYKDKPIYYSLGNFVFAQTMLLSRKTMIAKVIIKDKKVHKAVCIPVIRDYDGIYPRIATGAEKTVMKELILRISNIFNPEWKHTQNLYFE